MSTFKLAYRTRRWNSITTLTLLKTPTGWHLTAQAINGDTDPAGLPFFESNLRQDNVCFPLRVFDFLGFVWEQMDAGEIDAEQAQEMIQQIGEWITACEASQPIWQEWNS